MSGVLCVLAGSGGAFKFNATISSNTTNYNLNTAMTAAGWNGFDRVEATITINSGIYLGSTSNANPALRVNSLPATSSVLITNNGYILGKGYPAGFGMTIGAVFGRIAGKVETSSVSSTRFNSNSSQKKNLKIAIRQFP